MSSRSTRFDYVIYVDMKNFGNYVQPTHLLLIVYCQESGELNYPVPWALNIVGLSWWSGARTLPLQYPYPLVGIDSGGRPRQRDKRFRSRSSSCMIPGAKYNLQLSMKLSYHKKI
jgi:hypothetical protein